MNYFQVVAGLVNIAAAISYLNNGDTKLAGVMVCYAVACAFLSVSHS